MADAVVARREARKRKILENSEYRLQKISGQANHIEQQVERSKTTENEVPSNASISTDNSEVLGRESIIKNQLVDSLISELNAGIDAEESAAQSHYDTEHIFNLLSTPNVPHRRNIGRANVSNENGNTSGCINLSTSNNVRFSPERQDSLADMLMDNSDKDNQNANPIPDPSLINSILSSRLIYVALAIVVNIMVILKLEHLFGMSIIVPFFVIMIGRLCIFKNDGVSQGSNMLVAALILSNVRPDLVKVIHRLKGSFSLSGRIMQDFAVYIFTFVLLHTALHRYWNDLDDTLPVPVEVDEIFDNVIM